MTDQTILAAVDGSKNSSLAAGVAVRLARHLNAHLGLIHVLDTPTFSFWVGVEERMRAEVRAQAEATLGKIAERIHESCGIIPEFYIVEGLPEEKIPEALERNKDIMMVVIGSHGIGAESKARLPSLKLGHLADRLSSVLTVPLLVVPPNTAESFICPGIADICAMPLAPSSGQPEPL